MLEKKAEANKENLWPCTKDNPENVVYTGNSPCVCPGVKDLYGEAPPRGPTRYPFIYHFFRKGTPFVYLLLEKGTRFIYLTTVV